MKNVFFYHIPKTGGTSLSVSAQRAGYHYQWIGKGRDCLDFYEPYWIAGHHPFGKHREFAACDLLVTLLRDPVERIVSGYYMARQKRKDFNRSIEDHVISEDRHGLMNAQTKHLAGLPRGENIRGRSERVYERAVRNLEEKIDCVGVTDNLFEFGSLLLEELTGKNVRIGRLRYRKRPRGIDIPSEVREWAEQHNRFDRDLYERAKKIGVRI